MVLPESDFPSVFLFLSHKWYSYCWVPSFFKKKDATTFDISAILKMRYMSCLLVPCKHTFLISTVLIYCCFILSSLQLYCRTACSISQSKLSHLRFGKKITVLHKAQYIWKLWWKGDKVKRIAWGKVEDIFTFSWVDEEREQTKWPNYSADDWRENKRNDLTTVSMNGKWTDDEMA